MKSCFRGKQSGGSATSAETKDFGEFCHYRRGLILGLG
jgi:hypothetical protein